MPRAPLPPLSVRSRIRLQRDGTVVLEHDVTPEDDFARAATDVFALLKHAQDRHPGALRSLVLRIDGHAGERAGFDADLFEFQQEFLLGTLGRFFTRVDTPLTGKLDNGEPQQDDLADRLRIDSEPG